MALEVSRDNVEERLTMLSDFDAEDASELIDLLLERFTLVEAWSWILFYDYELCDIPLGMIERGRGREVLTHVRAMVANAKGKYAH